MNKMKRMLAALLALMLVLLTGCGGKEAADETIQAPVTTAPVAAVETTVATEAPEKVQLAVDSIEEQGDMMIVNTPFCVLKYPFAFADLIQVEAMNSADTAELVFSAKLDLSSYRLFSIVFGGSGDILLGSMMLPDGEAPVEVYATLYQIDETLSADFVNTFNAAQECFNDVMVSLMENEGFTPAE